MGIRDSSAENIWYTHEALKSGSVLAPKLRYQIGQIIMLPIFNSLKKYIEPVR